MLGLCAGVSVLFNARLAVSLLLTGGCPAAPPAAAGVAMHAALVARKKAKAEEAASGDVLEGITVVVVGSDAGGAAGAVGVAAGEYADGGRPY